MIIIYLIILVFASIVTIIDIFVTDRKFNLFSIFGILGSALLASLGLIFSGALIYYMFFSTPEPTAIDVYKEDAEIKIVYIDTIPTDTIVVWKENTNNYKNTYSK